MTPIGTLREELLELLQLTDADVVAYDAMQATEISKAVIVSTLDLNYQERQLDMCYYRALTAGLTLVAKTTAANPRRAADGFDYNRAVLLMAVAEKRAGLKLSVFDAYINVIGGLRLDEPGADLPVILAVASSYRDTPIAQDLAAIGEVGLTGEIRSVSHMNQRLQEVARLGFKKVIIPKFGSEKLEIPSGLDVYRVRNIREAIEVSM